MNKDTQLPAEVLEEIKQKAQLSTDFLSNDETLSKDYLKGYKQGWRYGGTEYATKLHDTQQEIEQLKRCKAEAFELLNPIIEYGQSKEAGIPLGQSITAVVLERCKQFTALQAKCERYKNALKRIETLGDGATILHLRTCKKIANEALSTGEGEKDGVNG